MTKRDRADGTFWISYSDLATALLLVFVLILLVFVGKTKETEQRAAQKERQLVTLEDEVKRMLEQREALAQRLDAAVQSANRDLCKPEDRRADKCRDVFRFVDQRVEVSEQDVAWFPHGQQALTPVGKHQLEVFFGHLYDQLLVDEGNVRIPNNLQAIDVLGHTDPTSRGTEWSWDSYAMNLRLSQGRALAVVEHIRSTYEAGRQSTKRPWRPFVALLNASGRSWTSTYCGASDPSPLTPQDFLERPAAPCAVGARTEETDRRSRRVSFGFRLDDREILEELQEQFRRTADETPSEQEGTR